MGKNKQKNINKMREVNENVINSKMMVKVPSTEITLKENNFKNYLGARRPILWIAHHDYIEIDNLLSDAISHLDNKMIYEYRAFGSVDFKTKEMQSEVGDLYNLIDTIYDTGMEQHTFLLLKNIDNELKESKNLAYLKKLAEMKYTNPDYNFTTIIVSEDENVPKQLEKFTSIIDVIPMDQGEIENYIKEFSQINNSKVDEKDLGEISISLKGLSKLEINHVLNMMVKEKNNISISNRNIIIKEKGQIIKKSAILELVDFKEDINQVGGLEGLKEWLRSKAKIFKRLDEAKKYGVDTPKGVLLVGMPGCGKSLAAKASARLFNAPLLRLDIGRLLGKYVGESEYNMRMALKMAESISPCILWIDEIEKAFAGIDQSGGASDITKRLFGHFLTWLQEKENTVFVVATANDISSFPPEFLRKGRFDEVFFVDFPNEEERENIFEIHLQKRGKNSDGINISRLAKETDTYCGADIEEIVKMSIERSFLDEVELDTDDLLNSIKEIDPLGEILKEKIDTLKEGYNKFKIKPAYKKVPKRVRVRKNGKKNMGKNSDDKDLVSVSGGKYQPSFTDEEISVMDLYVSKYLVTQDRWDEVMDENPSNFKGARRPVESIKWIDSLEFCNRMSEKYGLQPVYKIEEGELKRIIHLDGEEVYPALADFKKTEGYRLPTEAEWEWFARGGETARQSNTFNRKYKGSNELVKVAWCPSNSNKQTHDVGGLKPNDLGLYDIIGNLWEYVYDTGNNEQIFEEKPYLFDTSFCKSRSRGTLSYKDSYYYDSSNFYSSHYHESCWDDHYNSTSSSFYRENINWNTYNDTTGFRVVKTE